MEELDQSLSSLVLADALVAELPRCGEGTNHECPELAFWTVLDAAGDPYPACDTHKKPGGYDGDEGPFEKPYAKALRGYLDSRREALVGTFRRAGGCGPSYLVLAVKGGIAEIEFPESGERATLPVQAAMEDPVDK